VSSIDNIAPMPGPETIDEEVTMREVYEQERWHEWRERAAKFARVGVVAAIGSAAVYLGYKTGVLPTQGPNP
jgi:hypothetical protein